MPMTDYLDPDLEAEAALRRELYSPCLCGTGGAFCPAHGSYEPGSADLEILAAVRDNAARPRDRRIIRKHPAK